MVVSKELTIIMSSPKITQVYVVEDALPGVIYTLETPNGPIKVSFTLKKLHYSEIDAACLDNRRELWTSELRELFHEAVSILEEKKQTVEPKFIKIKMLDLSKGTELYERIQELTLDQMRSRWQKYRIETADYRSSNKLKKK